MKPYDPLSVDIHDEKRCPVLINLSTSHEPDLWFDGDRFIRYLKKTYSYFDVATYSFSIWPSLTIRRLITGLRFRANRIECQEHKLITNNHSKIFICYNNDSLSAVFIGSQNLTSGTNFNITYKAQKKHEKEIVKFFNQMWNARL
jgi:hypothetical protein